MKPRAIIVDENLREQEHPGTADYLITFDEQHTSDKGIDSIWHWHEEFQFQLVTHGTVKFSVENEEHILKKGSAIFYNSSCLHKAGIVDSDKGGIYVSISFPPSLIYGQMNSVVFHDYVHTVINEKALRYIVFDETITWMRMVIDLLEKLIAVERSQAYGYELKEKNLVNEIWYILVTNNKDKINESRSVSFEDRIKLRALQNYINKNFSEDLSLDSMAKAVHISRGECCRLFKRTINTTPFKYLMDYRINQSLNYLLTTDLSISEIALQVGFGSSSYYTECFRKKMKKTPLKYRQNARK